MVKIYYITALCFLINVSVQAQVQIDKPIDLNGVGANAKITGIKSVTSAQDAVSVEVLQGGSLVYASSAGTSAAYTLTLAPVLGGYTTGMEIRFKAHAANAAGVVTIDVNGLGAKAIKKDVSANLAAGDIQIGQLVTLAYDGVNFQLISRTTDANSGGTVTSISTTAPITGGTITSSGTIGISAATTSAAGSMSAADKAKLDAITTTFTGLANPTGSIGLTAINGSATTALRSDGTPALSQAIVPTWTGTHTFSNSTYSALFTGGNVGIGVASPTYGLELGGSFGYGNGTPGVYRSRTETRVDAGQIASQSGFFETSAPSPASNWPTNEVGGSSSWQHLIDVRHSNTANNYAMQIAGSFFDQDLFVRKTDNNPSTAWSRMVTSRDIVYMRQDDSPGYSTKNAWVDISVNTGNMTVRSGDVIKFDGMLIARCQTGSGDDFLYWRVLVENVSGGCATNAPSQFNYYHFTEAGADHDNFKAMPLTDYWVANCNGTVRFRLQGYLQGDDNWQVWSRRLIATRY